MSWIMLFVHDQCRFSDPEWSEAGGIPEVALRPFTSTVRSISQSLFAFLPLPRPSSLPLLPTPTRTIAFGFRYSLLLFISISPQGAIVYLLVPAFRCLPFRANLWLILSASLGGLYNPADPKSLNLEPPKLSTSCLFGCLFGQSEGVFPTIAQTTLGRPG